MRTRLSGSHYLHDPALYRLSLDGNLNLRLFKGLALNLNGRIEGIHNQIELASGGDDEEDILLRRKQQQTNFRYWGNFGLSYTFGSIYNNVVNPRFGG